MYCLPQGQILSLYPRQPSHIHVLQGRLWITSSDSHDDYFVDAGESLQLAAGAHVVLEAWNQNKSIDAQFAWGDSPTSPHLPTPSQTSAA